MTADLHALILRSLLAPVGMVDDELVSPQKLRQLADRIGRAEAANKTKRSTKRR